MITVEEYNNNIRTITELTEQLGSKDRDAAIAAAEELLMILPMTDCTIDIEKELKDVKDNK